MPDSYDRTVLIAELERDEGRRPLAYDDATGQTAQPGTLVKGWISVGCGRNLIGRGLTDEEITYLLNNDIYHVEAQLDNNLPGWRNFSDARQRAILNLCFNMGWGNGTHGLSSFKDTLAAMLAGDWDGAAAGILKSAYARQVGARAQRVADLIRNG